MKPRQPLERAGANFGRQQRLGDERWLYNNVASHVRGVFVVTFTKLEHELS